MLVLGLSGTFAAGKGTFIEIVKSHFNAYSVSTSDALRSEADKLGIIRTRNSLQELANKLVSQKGSGILAELSCVSIPSCDILIVDGLRRSGEFDFLEKKYGKNFHSVWIDADLKVRYERIKQRAREGESILSFQEFKVSEEKESNGLNSQNLTTCKNLCEFLLDNTSSRDFFEEKIVDLINKLLA
ncbi:AAA domain protein [uncultured archaeon]|nr:AAA domain protein [uncultured archaeon]